MIESQSAAGWYNFKLSGLLLDITGVLLNGPDPIAGSVDAYKRLNDAGISVRLVTNETTCTVDNLVDKLHKAGFLGVKKEQIFAPIPATKNYMIDNNLRPYFLIQTNALSDFGNIDTSDPNCVVIGDAEDHFNYENLNKAFNTLIKLKNPILISMGQGKYYSTPSGLNLDVGAFKTALEFACNIKAQVIGKPSEIFFMSAVRNLGLTPQEVLMVGDDIRNDIGGAQSCGIRSLLVRTGKFRKCDENDSVVKPDEIVDDFAQAVDKILDTYHKFK